MPFERVTPGTPQRISARDWNGAMDAARVIASGFLEPAAVRLPFSPGIRVKNSTTEDVPRFGVLSISSVVISPSDNLSEFQKILLVGGTPDAEVHSGKFVVTAEPIASGKIGSCIAMGIAPVLVDDGDGDFADVATGQRGYLARGPSGARILWVDNTESETPDRYWAYVAVGGGGGGGEESGCEAVHELRIDGSPSGGTIGLTYTIDGTTGSTASINHNMTSADARSALISANSAKLNTDNLKAYGGPLPTAALYFRFTESLSGQGIALPSISNSLTGTNVIPKIAHFTQPEWV